MNIFRRIFGKSEEEISDYSAVEKSASNHVSMEEKDTLVPPSKNHSLTEADTKPFKDDKDSTDDLSEDSEKVTVPFPLNKSNTVPDGVTRPLSMDIVTQVQHVTLTFGKTSHVGMVRENNQDSCLTLVLNSTTVDDRPDFGFFIVADGMGGHHDGEKASAITVETIAAEMLETIYIPMLKEFDDADRPTIIEALVSSAEKANRAVIKGVPDGGTTMTAIAVVGNLAYLAHVGDSRGYLIHNGEIEQLTRDHSLVQRLIELNQLTPEEASEHPQKNVLYRAIGQNENLEVERLIRPLPPGAQMLLCSDGLWGLVDNETMLKVVLSSPTPQDACDKLVALANQLGGTDNITVVILKIPSSK